MHLRPLGRVRELIDRAARIVSPHIDKPGISALWVRHGAPFNQGDLGSCTGNAVLGCLTSEPWYNPFKAPLYENDAQNVYSLATRLDNIEGSWPPDDTGSSGDAACRAAQQMGYCDGYHNAWTASGALAMLAYGGPIAIGIEWYTGFDNPEGDAAQLIISGEVRGEHELEVNEIDVDAGMIFGPNSWGTDWGNGGYWSMSFETFEQLFDNGGDAVQPYKNRPV